MNQSVTFIDQLKEKKIKPSYPRIKILEYLHKNLIHPNAEEIFQDLRPQIESLSRTTVYNTLKVFQENNIITALDLGTGNIHYDIITDLHAHSICNQCRKIFDIPVEKEFLKKLTTEDFIISNLQITAQGLCKKCFYQ